KDLMQIMLDHIEGTPDLAPLQEAEQQIIRKALAKNPDQRYPNCQEFVRALAEVLAPERGQASRLLSETQGGGTTAPGAVSERKSAAATTEDVSVEASGSETYATMRAEPTPHPVPRPAWRDRTGQVAASRQRGRGW